MSYMAGQGQCFKMGANVKRFFRFSKAAWASEVHAKVVCDLVNCVIGEVIPEKSLIIFLYKF